MSVSVTRAVDLIRGFAEDPADAAALLLATATIADWIERTDQPLPTGEANVRSLLLGAAAVLEAEYANAAQGSTDHGHAS